MLPAHWFLSRHSEHPTAPHWQTTISLTSKPRDLNLLLLLLVSDSSDDLWRALRVEQCRGHTTWSGTFERAKIILTRSVTLDEKCKASGDGSCAHRHDSCDSHGQSLGYSASTTTRYWYLEESTLVQTPSEPTRVSRITPVSNTEFALSILLVVTTPCADELFHGNIGGEFFSPLSLFNAECKFGPFNVRATSTSPIPGDVAIKISRRLSTSNLICVDVGFTTPLHLLPCPYLPPGLVCHVENQYDAFFGDFPSLWSWFALTKSSLV